jgi:hypothetical protein
VVLNGTPMGTAQWVRDEDLRAWRLRPPLVCREGPP